jgi:DNA repair protein RadC
LALSPVGLRWSARDPATVADRLVAQLAGVEHEELHVLLLDVKCAVIGQVQVYRGSINGAPVRAGEVFREAVKRQASAIIVCHNHPSSDPEPSDADREVTTDLARAGAVLDIALLDHIIVAGTRFVSLRARGAIGDDAPSPRALGDPGPSWRDPGLSIYKSALQKYIRRGEIEKAAAAAVSLGTRPGGAAALARRLPVIAAEDVGAPWLPAIGGVLNAVGRPVPPEAMGALVSVAAALASVPKAKEPYWLAATCWDGRRVLVSISPHALEAALANGRYEDATAICLLARERREWRSGPRVLDALARALADAPATAQDIAHWALWRERLGGYGTGELIAAAVLAAIDRPTEPLADLPRLDVANDPLVRIDWYTQDAHTPLGRSALARSARVLDMPTTMLNGLMFNFESIRLGPVELPGRWQSEALALDAAAGGWGNHERGSAIWMSVRDLVRREIESELTRWTARLEQV